MKYTLFVALKGIKQNRWSYLVLFLELVLCFSLIFIGLNKVESENKRFALINEVESKGFLTNYYEVRQNLTQEQISNFETHIMNDSDCSFSIINQINFSDGDKIRSVPLLIANQSFIAEYVSSESQEADIFIGKDNYSKFKTDGDMSPTDGSLSVREGNWYLNNRKLTVKTFDKLQNSILPTNIDYLRDIHLNDAIILNGSKIFLGGDQNLEASNIFLKIKGDINTVREKLNHLNGLFFPYSPLKINSLTTRFEKGAQDIMEFISVFSWASQVAFLIVFIGILGVLLILLEKRRKKLSLAIILGASKIRVLLEIFLELFMLTASASFISLVISCILQPYISSVYYLIEISYKTILSSIVLPLLMSSIPVLFIFRTYFTVNLLELMKYDG